MILGIYSMQGDNSDEVKGHVEVKKSSDVRLRSV